MEKRKEAEQPEWIKQLMSLINKKADQKEATPPYKAEAPITSEETNSNI